MRIIGIRQIALVAAMAGAGLAAWQFLRQPVAKPKGGDSAPATNGAGRNGHGATKDELYKRAAQLGIRGRSKMTKSELQAALSRISG